MTAGSVGNIASRLVWCRRRKYFWCSIQKAHPVLWTLREETATWDEALENENNDKRRMMTSASSRGWPLVSTVHSKQPDLQMSESVPQKLRVESCSTSAVEKVKFCQLVL
jgi:hypothetical protein